MLGNLSFYIKYTLLWCLLLQGLKGQFLVSCPRFFYISDFVFTSAFLHDLLHCMVLKKTSKTNQPSKSIVQHASQTFQAVDSHWEISTYVHLYLPCSEMAKVLPEAVGSCEAAVSEGSFKGEERLLLVNLVQSLDQKLCFALCIASFG